MRGASIKEFASPIRQPPRDGVRHACGIDHSIAQGGRVVRNRITRIQAGEDTGVRAGTPINDARLKKASWALLTGRNPAFSEPDAFIAAADVGKAKVCAVHAVNHANLDFGSLARLASAVCVMVAKVLRVLITCGSSITSIKVPSGRARATNNSGSNSSVRVMRTPA